MRALTAGVRMPIVKPNCSNSHRPGSPGHTLTSRKPAMSQTTTLNLALEALTLAAECGGETDRDIYLEAKQKLEKMVEQVIAYGVQMDSAERPPDGDDYNRLLSILEI